MSHYQEDYEDDDYAPPTTATTSPDLPDSPDQQPHFTAEDEHSSHVKQSATLQAKQLVPSQLKLYDSYEDKTKEALRTFINLEETTYQLKSLGQAESASDLMSCQCHPQYESSDNEEINHACEDDDCINRGTKIECAFGHRNYCGVNCANQRFARKEYADIAVFKTEKKGYGVRVEADLEPDTFVYEYIGEVIDEKAFKKRMVEYDQKKFKHFYFMMLQRGEFIDATVKGSLGRFCNHSCNPNCYVEKWVVGDKLKMGIFTKRRIVKGEELTFNYNVDRYGADSQPCYCGEVNCIGYIGGKTQTDSASLLPQIYAEALGSSVDQELQFVMRKKEQGFEMEKNNNGVNVEYVNSLTMRPIEIYQVSKVSAALLQCEDSLILDKLILRIEKTNNEIIKKLYFTHGIQCFKRIIKIYIKDNEGEDLVLRIFAILQNGPTVSKNYIQRTGTDSTIRDLIETTAPTSAIHNKAKEVIDRFSHFEERHIIKKRSEGENKPVFASFHSRQNINTNGNGNSSSTLTPQLSIYQQQQQQGTFPSFDLAQLQQLNQTLTGVSPQRTPQPLAAYTHTTNAQDYNQSGEPQESIAAGGATGDGGKMVSADNHGLPKHWEVYSNEKGIPYYYNTQTQVTQWEKPDTSQLEQERRDKLQADLKKLQQEEEQRRQNKEMELQAKLSEKERKLKEIIEKARKVEEEMKAKELIEKKKEEESLRKKEEYKAKLKSKKSREQQLKLKAVNSGTSTPSPSISSTEAYTREEFNKRWSHLFAKVVAHSLKPRQSELGSHFKEVAREITKTLVDKEWRKNPNQRTPENNQLEAGKYKKVKAFSTEYADKVLVKIEERRKRKATEEGQKENEVKRSKV